MRLRCGRARAARDGKECFTVKTLILHDLAPADAEMFLPSGSEECIVFPATPPVRYCIGCFGCWIRTPGRCVIADRGADFVAPLSLCDEFIVISRMVFGGFSPDVKAVLDRSIGIIMPFFRQVNGEMHHTKRFDKTPDMRYLFYGPDINGDEKKVAEKLVAANCINLGFGHAAAEFYPTVRACAEASMLGTGAATESVAAGRENVETSS
jgi:hypothetical protein